MNFHIIGTGRVVTEYYLPAFAATGVAGTVTVVDGVEANLAAAAGAGAFVRCVQQDFRSYLASLRSAAETAAHDAVIIALPNTLHVDACNLALDRRLPVLCEKPLSLDMALCRHLDERAKSSATPLAVAMVRRFLPSWMLARQIIPAGELGPVQSVEVYDCAPFGWRPRSFDFFAPGAGGILADMGVHYLDFLDQILGPLEPVGYSDDARGGVESNFRYDLRAGGVSVSIVMSRTHAGKAYIKIIGEKATLTLGKFDELNATLEPHGLAKRTVKLAEPFAVQGLPGDLRGSFCAMLADFHGAATGGVSKLATAADAGRAAALIAWAYEKQSFKEQERHLSSRTGSRARVGGANGGDTVVTGGSGFVGGHLVERLSHDGDRVRCLVRSTATVSKLARFPVDLRQVDLLDKDAVLKAVAGSRVVYHLAYGQDGPNAAKVTIEGTQNIVEAAIAGGAEAIVVLSTAYVFGFPDGGLPVDEEFPYAPYGGVYGSSKSKMEQWCLQRAKSSGSTRIVVLNPTNVFGPSGGAYTTLPVTLAKQGAFCWIDGGQGVCNYTFVENLVDAILAAASVADAHGQRFIVTDGAKAYIDFLGPFVSKADAHIANYTSDAFNELTRKRDVFRTVDLAKSIIASPGVRDVMRRSRLVQTVSRAPAARRLWQAMQSERPQGGLIARARATPVPPAWLHEIYHSHHVTFSAQHAADVLGWSPRVGWDEARDTTLQWLGEAGYL